MYAEMGTAIELYNIISKILGKEKIFVENHKNMNIKFTWPYLLIK